MLNLPTLPRTQLSALGNLTPDRLSRVLDQFSCGRFYDAARVFDAIENRDDIIKGVAGKRKKAPARLPWEVVVTSSSQEAVAQKNFCDELLNNLTVTDASDRCVRGGLALLIEQMMDAVGKRYAVHEIRWDGFDGTSSTDVSPALVTLQFVPLWAFRREKGFLEFAPDGTRIVPVRGDRWMVCHGEGLMEASSIAYLYKHLPLRDWLVYCERNGMPAITATTDAQPGTAEWRQAQEAVEKFGAEFSAVLSHGATLSAVDVSSSGTLPYPGIVERMDQAITALWRGADLGTISSANTGASLQKSESDLIEEHDCRMIAETISTQLLGPAIARRFGAGTISKCRFTLQRSADLERDIAYFKLLHDLDMELPTDLIYARLGLPNPKVTNSAV